MRLRPVLATLAILSLACGGPDSGGKTEPDCGDGVDGDEDGLVDCADPDCDAICYEDCADGADNDADSAVDCDDPECVADSACSSWEGLRVHMTGYAPDPYVLTCEAVWTTSGTAVPTEEWSATCPTCEFVFDVSFTFVEDLVGGCPPEETVDFELRQAYGTYEYYAPNGDHFPVPVLLSYLEAYHQWIPTMYAYPPGGGYIDYQGGTYQFLDDSGHYVTDASYGYALYVAPGR